MSKYYIPIEQNKGYGVLFFLSEEQTIKQSSLCFAYYGLGSSS